MCEPFIFVYVGTELFLYMTVTFDFVASTTIYKSQCQQTTGRHTHWSIIILLLFLFFFFFFSNFLPFLRVLPWRLWSRVGVPNLKIPSNNVKAAVLEGLCNGASTGLNREPLKEALLSLKVNLSLKILHHGFVVVVVDGKVCS